MLGNNALGNYIYGDVYSDSLQQIDTALAVEQEVDIRTIDYESERTALSRKYQAIIDIILDECSLTHGVAPCTATQTGDAKCYNARSNCNDPDNYTQSADGKVYKFSLVSAVNPIPGQIIRPYAKKFNFLATKIDPKNVLTHSARITIEFEDEPDNDIGIDKYITDRSYFPDDVPGTFWRKLLARNLYYRGRTLLLKEGFFGLGEGAYDVRKYFLDQISISNKGIVKVVAKDILKRADRRQVPTASSGWVTDDPLTDGAMTINYDTTDLSEYPDPSSEGNFYIRIDDELIEISANNRGTKQFTVANRGVDIGSIATAPTEHDEDSKIQLCYVQIGENGVDILLDILQNEFDIDSSDIKVSEFESERDTWLAAFIFTGIISKPIMGTTIINELLEQLGGSSSWWSEEEQLIRFKAFAPPLPGEADTVATLKDENNISKIQIDNNEESRVSRTIVYYNRKSLNDEDKTESYLSHSQEKDTDAESIDQYNEQAGKNIFSRWIITTSIADSVATRYQRRFRNPPKILKFTLELKDNNIQVGDVPIVETDHVVDKNGNRLEGRMYQVLEKKQRSQQDFDYEAMDTAWDKNYAVIAPAGYPDWDSASAAQKRYGYIAGTNGKLGANDDEPFYIF